MTAPNLTLVTQIPDPDPVANLMHLRNRALYKRCRELTEAQQLWMYGFMASMFPDATRELLDITEAAVKP